MSPAEHCWKSEPTAAILFHALQLSTKGCMGRAKQCLPNTDVSTFMASSSSPLGFSANFCRTQCRLAGFTLNCNRSSFKAVSVQAMKWPHQHSTIVQPHCQTLLAYVSEQPCLISFLKACVWTTCLKVSTMTIIELVNLDCAAGQGQQLRQVWRIAIVWHVPASWMHCGALGLVTHSELPLWCKNCLQLLQGLLPSCHTVIHNTG